MLLLDDVQALQQVIMTELDIVIIELPELVEIALGLECQLRQVDGREGEVAAGTGFLRAVDVAHDARAAAHRGNGTVVIARLVILQVVRRVDIDEIREEALGTDLGPTDCN